MHSGSARPEHINISFYIYRKKSQSGALETETACGEGDNNLDAGHRTGRGLLCDILLSPLQSAQRS